MNWKKMAKTRWRKSDMMGLSETRELSGVCLTRGPSYDSVLPKKKANREMMKRSM